MRHADRRGFTLIELLVVIAIIGILSAVILASLNTARLKGRDTRRLSDLNQIRDAIALINTNTSATAFVGCTAAGARATTCTTPDLSKYTDPSGSVAACTTASAGTCDYSVGKNTLATASPDSENYEVCAYLEAGVGPRTTPGLISLDNTGTIRSGCN